MKSVVLTLPGGLERNGVIDRKLVLEPINGYLERAICEELVSTENLPKSITSIIASTVKQIGGADVDRHDIASLCVADRQYIMMHLALLLDGDIVWLNDSCNNCSESYDVCVRRSDLPVRQAGPSYPEMELQCNGHRIKLRVPTGDDQEKIASIQDEPALKELIIACIVEIEPHIDQAKFVDSLQVNHIEQIESALENMSPAVCTSIQTTCPECGTTQTLYMDPYAVNALGSEALYAEVHALAFNYHWSEAEILGLPRYRRQHYLKYIEATNGIYS